MQTELEVRVAAAVLHFLEQQELLKAAKALGKEAANRVCYCSSSSSNSSSSNSSSSSRNYIFKVIAVAAVRAAAVFFFRSGI